MSSTSEAKFSAADLEPYLRARPEAEIVVNLGGTLISVGGVYYDNEYGIHVLELDPEEAEVALKLLNRRDR